MAASVTGSLKRYKTYYPITIPRQAGEISALRGMASDRSAFVGVRAIARITVIVLKSFASPEKSPGDSVRTDY